MSRTFLLILIPFILLVACTAAPAATPAPTNTPTATATPQPTNTPLPTSTTTATTTSTPRPTSTATATVTPTATLSPLVTELLQPGKVVKHPPTASNPYSWYSYFPTSAMRKKNIIIGVWPHGGGASSNNYADHEQKAESTLSGFRSYAEEFQVPLIIVAIPRVNRMTDHALPLETFTTTEELFRRTDLKLIDAVWNQFIPTLRKAEFIIDERVFMFGFSSPGMFTHRFAMLHPERIKAIWLGAEAPAPLPVAEFKGRVLEYPLGISNLEALTGKPFDWNTFRQIPHMIVVGENDTVANNDTTASTDIFTEGQRQFIRANFGDTNPKRIQFYNDFLISVGIKSQFKLYSGVGHQIPAQMLRDAFSFLVANSGAAVPTPTSTRNP